MTTSDAVATQRSGLRPSGLRIDYQRFLNLVFWFCSFAGSVVFIEPSPYDILILLTIALWVLGGFTIHRGVLPFVFLLGMWVFGGFVSLIPYWHEEDPQSFMAHTLFIATTGIFYSLFFAENTKQRIAICLNGYAASCVLAAIIAIVTWLGTFGSGEEWVKDGRAMLPFKDPNVLGSYMVPGILYYVQRILLGRIHGRLLWLTTIVSLGLCSIALFLSFSRGSWLAAAISLTLMTAMTFVTANSGAMRQRVVICAALVLITAVLGILIILSNSQIREFFFMRAAVQQDYDAGTTGRFGNQLRALPMLLDLPNGFGPLRFRLTFGIEPHNAFINAFASNGWLGGFAFVILIVMTTYVGFRGCFTYSPYAREMQIVWCATFVFFLQAMQIDIDHWRMFYVTFGAVWGVEAARIRWQDVMAYRALLAEHEAGNPQGANAQLKA